MKKLFTLLLACLLFVGCSSAPATSTETSAPSTTDGTSAEPTKLVVSATLDPHAKILEFAKPILLEDYNIDLEIEVLDDYYIFNKALDAGEVDANYFQHLPFFNDEVEANGYDIVNAGGIHIEPFGFYSQTVSSVDEVPDGATVIISNSVSDHGRILTILAHSGLITLADDVDAISATVEDIVDNPKNLQFKEIKPELLSLAYENNEGDLVAINGNYAMQAGLNPVEDAVILESADETNPYVNIIACRSGDETRPEIQALVEVLKSDEVKQFVEETYGGSVILAE